MAFELCGYEYKEIQELESRIASKIRPEAFNSDRFVAYLDSADPQSLAMWTFTLKGSTPYPAVVCRQLQNSPDGWNLSMGANCLGTTPQCDGLMEEFKKLNEVMIKNFNRLNGR
jgi:hypothetical protein